MGTYHVSSSRQSPLHDRHVAAGATFAPFGGWEMPVSYKDGGILAEHAAVRDKAGIFDVSHLGKVRVKGAGASRVVNRCLTNDLDRINDGRAQYTLCCNADGGIVDDLIVYQYSADHIFCIPNAANAENVATMLSGDASSLAVTNEHEAFAVIAVQGPESAGLLESVGFPSQFAYMSFADVEWKGTGVTICRTGYTGEHGYELVVTSDRAVDVWDAFAKTGVQLCGLGARDTLRTEMGYPLHGQDISLNVNPVEAGLGWAVGWNKPSFWGRDALMRAKEAGPRRKLWGLLAGGRDIPRGGMRVYAPGVGAPVGTVTSGTFSPTLGVGVALAYLDVSSDVTENSHVEVEIRRRRARMRVMRPPFVASRPTS